MKFQADCESMTKDAMQSSQLAMVQQDMSCDKSENV